MRAFLAAQVTEPPVFGGRGYGAHLTKQGKVDQAAFLAATLVAVNVVLCQGNDLFARASFVLPSSRVGVCFSARLPVPFRGAVKRRVLACIL
jgi:hypothetical protein